MNSLLHASLHGESRAAAIWFFCMLNNYAHEGMAIRELFSFYHEVWILFHLEGKFSSMIVKRFVYVAQLGVSQTKRSFSTKK
jgi:hypothetical protein